MRRNLSSLSVDEFIGREVPERPGYRLTNLVKGGCNGLVFRADNEELGHTLACKIVPRSNLISLPENPLKWLDEIRKSTILRSPVAVRFNGYVTWPSESSGVECVGLLFDFIDGCDLHDFITDKANEVNIHFVETFLRSMLQLFQEMKEKNIQHGDLHSKNILVERQALLGVDPYAFRVTDFGVIAATDDTALRDDFEQLANVLTELLKRINYQSAGAKDRYIYDVLNNEFIKRHLTQTDPTRDAMVRNPRAMHERLDQLNGEFTGRMTIQLMSTPFDYLNCEQIGDAHFLLRSLYSDRFLGVSDIQARNNLVLTGPRGCGKSTVFKSQSLRHQLSVELAEPDTTMFLGVYYNCVDLWAAFPRYHAPNRQDALDLPVHYLTASLLCEVFESVSEWSGKYFSQEFKIAEPSLADEIWEVLELSKPSEPGARSLHRLSISLQKERNWAIKKQRFLSDQSHTISLTFGPEALIKVCQILIDGLSFLKGKPFYFFIDDYSTPKISEALQRSLNRIVMRRTATCFFKISTESPVSYVRGDIDQKEYVEGREFILVNLGLTFLSSKMEEKLAFIDDVFSRRFGAVKEYPVQSLLELLGHSKDESHNDIAVKLRRKEKIEVSGRECLSELCSGDIFYIITLVARMVRESGGETGLRDSKDSPRIAPSLQSDVIRREAGDFLTAIQRVKFGERLVQIVNAFGSVAFSYLKYRNSKNEKGSPPCLVSRIEPYEDLGLSGEAKEIYCELLRYSLFIEDPRGKSRRGKAVPRLYLRRSLLPHFNLTFSKRDSVELEPSEVEELLLRPNDFEVSHRLKKHLNEDDQMGINDIIHEDN